MARNIKPGSRVRITAPENPNFAANANPNRQLITYSGTYGVEGDYHYFVDNNGSVNNIFDTDIVEYENDEEDDSYDPREDTTRDFTAEAMEAIKREQGRKGIKMARNIKPGSRVRITAPERVNGGNPNRPRATHLGIYGVEGDNHYFTDSLGGRYPILNDDVVEYLNEEDDDSYDPREDTTRDFTAEALEAIKRESNQKKSLLTSSYSKSYFNIRNKYQKMLRRTKALEGYGPDRRKNVAQNTTSDITFRVDRAQQPNHYWFYTVQSDGHIQNSYYDEPMYHGSDEEALEHARQLKIPTGLRGGPIDNTKNLPHEVKNSRNRRLRRYLREGNYNKEPVRRLIQEDAGFNDDPNNVRNIPPDQRSERHRQQIHDDVRSPKYRKLEMTYFDTADDYNPESQSFLYDNVPVELLRNRAERIAHGDATARQLSQFAGKQGRRKRKAMTTFDGDEINTGDRVRHVVGQWGSTENPNRTYSDEDGDYEENDNGQGFIRYDDGYVTTAFPEYIEKIEPDDHPYDSSQTTLTPVEREDFHRRMRERKSLYNIRNKYRKMLIENQQKNLRNHKKSHKGKSPQAMRGEFIRVLQSRPEAPEYLNDYITQMDMNSSAYGHARTENDIHESFNQFVYPEEIIDLNLDYTDEE